MKLIELEPDGFRKVVRAPDAVAGSRGVYQELVRQCRIAPALGIDHLTEQAQALRLSVDDLQAHIESVALMEFAEERNPQFAHPQHAAGCVAVGGTEAD